MPSAEWRVYVDWDANGFELVRNGGFDSGGDWTLYGSGISIGAGKLSFAGTAGAYGYQHPVVTPGRRYRLTYTVSGFVSGRVVPVFWLTSGSFYLSQRTADGTYLEEFTAPADATGHLVMYAEGTLSIDDVSVIDAEDDITNFVTGVSWRRGRDRASSLTGQALSLSFEIRLDNSDGRFNSFLATGPLYGKLLPGRKVKCTSTWGGVTLTQFVGYVSAIEPQPELGGGHTAVITGMGPLGKIREQSVSVALLENRDTGSIIEAILDAAGWPASERVIDKGATVVPFFYAPDKRNVLGLIRELEASEGGCLYETKDGRIGFESRMRRLMPPYSVSQAVLSDDPAAPLAYEEISQADPVEEIFNKVTATVHVSELQSSALLWTLPETGEYSPVIQPGESKAFWTTLDSSVVAVREWTTPVAGTDFLANSKPDGTGTNLTGSIAVSASKFSTAMKVTLTNGGATPAFITLLQARGSALVELDTVSVRSEDSASQAKYGIREFPIEAPWLPSSFVAQGYCDEVVSDYRDPNPILTVAFSPGRSAAQLAEALARDFGDRVTLVADGAAGLGIDGDFYVEAVSHSVEEGGLRMRTSYELSSADVVDSVWILGTSVLGTGTILADIW